MARAKYLWPALTILFFLKPKSRTSTAPRVTVVSVPAHVSVMDHFVPRTVASLLRPRDRKWPCTLENSERLFFRAAVVCLGAPPRGTLVEQLFRPPPVIDTVVSGFLRACRNLNWPLLKWPVWVPPEW